MTVFWWTWPSWVVEGLSGALLQISLHLWGHHAVGICLTAGCLISAIYEAFLDRHGWSWRDFLQRAIGQIVTEILWGLT